MIWWQPPQTRAHRKKWWDTPLSRKFGAQGLAARLWLKHFYPYAVPDYQNDRDALRW
jgi:hypothetical protein